MPAMAQRCCPVCKTKFEARAADVARGWGIYCSKRCKAIKQEQRTGQNAAYHNRHRHGPLDDERNGFQMSQADLAAGGYGDSGPDDPLCDGKF